MESTLLVMTQGEAGIDCCDPFVDALKKRTAVQKYGPHIVICDLLVLAVRDGSSICMKCLVPSFFLCTGDYAKLCH